MGDDHRSLLREHRGAVLDLVAKQPGPDPARDPRRSGGAAWHHCRNDDAVAASYGQQTTLKKRRRAASPRRSRSPMPAM
jgi:hypothetical protein